MMPRFTTPVIRSGARNPAAAAGPVEMPRGLGMTGTGMRSSDHCPGGGSRRAKSLSSSDEARSGLRTAGVTEPTVIGGVERDGVSHASEWSASILSVDRPPARIAVFRALFLGDLLCATPALRALRQRFPEAEITLIGLPWARELVARLPCVDRLEEFPGYPGILEVPYQTRRTEEFLARARATGYDLALQMHGSGQVSNGFVAALGARVSLGYRLGSDDRLTASLPWIEEEHESVRWLRLVSMVGARPVGPQPEFPMTVAEERRAAELLESVPTGTAPLIGIHPGAKDASRRWPPERFAALADALTADWGARIVLTGGVAEREITATVRHAMRAPALDLAGETDLGTFAAVIARLDLLVTNDTGASHLAAATGTRSVVLFGPTRPERWAPLDRERHLVVDAAALAGPGVAPAEALARLPVQMVLEACIRVTGGGWQVVGTDGHPRPATPTEALCAG